MPTEAYTRVQCEGTLGQATAPYEIFSYSFAVDHEGDLITDAGLSTIAAVIQAFHASPSVAISSRAVLRAVSFHHRGADGKQDSPTRTFTMTTPGGNNAEQGPASQTALCVSLRGPSAVRPVRGRFYLPLPMSSVDLNTGVIPAGDALAVANRVAVLANGIHSVSSDVKLSIASRSGVVPVTEIRVGRVLDTIRRRRNSNPEAYVPATTALL